MRVVAKCLFVGVMLAVVATTAKATLDPTPQPKPPFTLLCMEYIRTDPQTGLDFPGCIGGCPNPGEQCSYTFDIVTGKFKCICA
jgi:hypothetical protein